MWRVGLVGGVLMVLSLGRSGAAAEVFVLSAGGRIEGTLVNRDESPREKYVIQTATGQLTLAKSQVEQVLYPKPAELEYDRICSTFPDTVEGQLKLAAWCLEQGLSAQRRTHLERVIELDPEHAEARRVLGYIKANGQWTTSDDLNKSRGYLRYRGRWRSPQEVEVLQKKERAEKAEKEWAQKLDRWHSGLLSDRSGQALEAIHAINDPNAVKPLSQLMRRDAPERVRLLYIETLARIGTDDALQALAYTSLNDGSQEVRLSAVDQLAKKKSPAVVAYYVGQLKSKDNRLVNRAAIGLSHMADRSAVLPLIDALWTTHKFKAVSGNGSAGAMSTTFSSSGNGGMSMGGGVQIFKKDLQNQAVLDALVMLTGVNYAFEVHNWKAWFASQKQHSATDVRRN